MTAFIVPRTSIDEALIIKITGATNNLMSSLSTVAANLLDAGWIGYVCLHGDRRVGIEY